MLRDEPRAESPGKENPSGSPDVGSDNVCGVVGRGRLVGQRELHSHCWKQMLGERQSGLYQGKVVGEQVIRRRVQVLRKVKGRGWI